MSNEIARYLPLNRKLWALQLTNTEHRRWDNTNLYGEVTFQWKDIETDHTENLPELSASIAKKYSNYSTDRIVNLAKAILNYKKIKRGDFVLGVYGDTNVEKTGFIEEVDHDFNKKIKLNITWLGLVEPTHAKKAIFDKSQEIQQITKTQLKHVTIDLDRLNKVAPAVEEKYSEMSDSYSFAKSPIKDKIDEDDDGNGGKIKLFYGTNRNDTGKSDIKVRYGNDSSEMSYGTCWISIPKTHTEGELERPNLCSFELRENPEKHIVIESYEDQKKDHFFEEFRRVVGQIEEKSALLFIHGYNVDFEEAARRTGQLAWDIPFDGYAGFFSWPSSGFMKSYLADGTKAANSVPALTEFIENLVSDTGIKKLHLIAHSMGNRILAASLVNLSRKNDIADKLKIIHQIVLGAADIDQKMFREQIMPEFKNVGFRRTLYASEYDSALNISEILRERQARLGAAGISLYLDNDIDTVDASNVPKRGNGHSYIFEEDKLLSDLHYLIRQDLPPNQRRLLTKKREAYYYWQFPKSVR